MENNKNNNTTIISVCIAAALVLMKTILIQANSTESSELVVAVVSSYSTDLRYQFDMAIKDFRSRKQVGLTASTKLQLKAAHITLKENGTSFLQLWQQVSSIVKRNTSVILYEERTGKTCLIAHMANQFDVPAVGLVFPGCAESLGEPQTSMPPWFVRFGYALKDIFLIMGWKKFAVIATQSMDGEQFVNYFGEMAGRNSLEILATANVDVFFLEPVISKVYESRARVIILYCHLKEARDILESAKEKNMIGSDFAWLVVTDEESLNFRGLPDGILLIHPEGSIQHTLIQNHKMTKRMGLFLDLLFKSASFRRPFSKNTFNAGYQPFLNMSSSLHLPHLIKKEHKLSWNLHHSLHGENENFNPKPILLSGVAVSNTRRLPGKHESTTVGVGRWVEGELRLYGIAWYGGRSQVPRDEAAIPQLRLTLAESPPWVMLRQQDRNRNCPEHSRPCIKHLEGNKTDTICVYGVGIDVLWLIEERARFKSEIHYSFDGKFGMMDPRSKKWNGMVQELLEGKADLALGLTIDARRNKDIDFSYSCYELELSLLVKRETKLEAEKDIDWENFLRPFSPIAWIAMIALANAFIIILWFSDRISPYGNYKIANQRKRQQSFSIIEVIFYTWGIVWSRDIGTQGRPKSLGARVMATSFSAVTLIIATAYSANLAAFLIAEDKSTTITGFDDPKLLSSSFKYGLVADTRDELYFRFNTDVRLQRMYQLMRGNRVRSLDEGCKRVKDGTLSAFIAEKPSLQHIVNMDPDCQLDVVGQSFAKSSWALGLPKGSPWTETISQAIVDLQSFLYFEDIYEKWKDGSSCVHGNKGFFRMKPTDLAGLFFYLSGLLCLFLVCVAANIALERFTTVCKQSHHNLHVSCNAAVITRSGQFHVNAAVIED